MGLKLIPPGQGRSEKEYYVRFEGSMYGVLHVDNTAHTVSLVPLKRLDNIPVFVEPLDPYKLCGVRVFDVEGRKVVTIELAQPTDPLPVYVAALKEALVGSRVQSVSATDGGLCLHLDDDYDAVTNGALRVRIHPERVPFTVGDVFVNRDGADLVLCVCAQASEEDKNANKPVVAFKIDRDILDRKELSFNVI